ncbi:uncharacterized protein DUF2627 [Melghirimyces profundicolus]|uniref:Uncharacterized protein DUF2627 n=1 Tax=Melghirimyces profundicolus TaxID=1242148 RepID=A0A2T6B811_9BACL|nr:DUF2627 family protein [Melghirimyces profundicolus]PTX52193.1 uncharacterized protein DUF2627 [Melghirimyces profundicolus]
MIYQRLLAIVLLCIPGAAGIYGWTLMKDVIFNALAGEPFAWFPFIGGLILFLGGLSFVAGFLFYRDAKNNYVQPMLLPRRKKKRKNHSGNDIPKP